MHPITTVYFPYTTISSPRQFPIFMLFAPLHLLRPVENGRDGDRSADTFMNSPFCQVHTPCPLGADLDRFRRLVSDIAQRNDDYPSQLAALTLAELSSWQNAGEDSQGAISRALRGAIEEPQEVLNHREKLWLARLVLAIGELLDCQEEEIRREMAQIAEEEAGLFRELHGEEEGEEEEGLAATLIQRAMAERIDPSSIGKRFAAWRQLFREAALADCNLLLTTCREAGDLLLDAYEQHCGLAPTALTTLYFPEHIGEEICGLPGNQTGKQADKQDGKQDGDQIGSQMNDRMGDGLRNHPITQEAEALSAVTAFVEANQTLLDSCRQSLAAVACAGTDQTADKVAALEEQLAIWHNQLATAFPSSHFGRRQYRLFLLSGLSSTGLLTGKRETAGTVNSLLLVAG